MTTALNDPIHPGEILADELAEIGMNGAQLAGRLNVPANRIYEILNGKRNITADTALRLGRFFKGTANLWLNLQKSYELDMALGQGDDSLRRIIPYQPESRSQ